MSYQVLSRKWRPQKFQDVVGQSHITQALAQSIIRDSVGHAYLLTGTRGIGKTSVARILARALRCTDLLEDGNPCMKCVACKEMDESQASMNIIEIDGASYNKVEDIREVVNNVHYLPTTGKRKVYIIDEVHMLSVSAFNALLKTLEEPPAHVVFIFATTEPHKLLGTILSRCQRMDFRNASVVDLTEHLKKILIAESISWDNDSLLIQIATQGNGSFRDTLSLMDQVLSYSVDQKITEEVVAYSLGLAKASSLRDIVSAMLLGQDREVSKIYNQLLIENIDLDNLVKSILSSIYKIIDHIDDEQKLVDDMLLTSGASADISVPELFWLYECILKDYTWMKDSIDSTRAFELLLRKASLRREFLAADPVQREKKTPESTPVAAESASPNELTPEPEAQPEPASEVTPEPVPQEPVSGPVTDVEASQVEQAAEEEEASEPEEVPDPRAITVNISDHPEEGPWENFLAALHGISPATASNLEQGNLTQELVVSPERVRVSLGFSKEAEVFYDYINDPEVLKKIRGYLADHFKVELEAVHVELTKVEPETSDTEQKEFKSRAQILEEKEIHQEQVKKENFGNDPLIKKAEELFGAKVDKIVVNKQ